MDPHLKLQGAPQLRAVLTFALRQAIEILQMPQIELAQWIREEIEKNPLLEEKPSSMLPSKRGNLEEISSRLSLYEHIMKQIEESLFTIEEKKIALYLYQSLDERGFLQAPIEELAREGQLDLIEAKRVLTSLQNFDPPGIFAKNLQESLLLQLKALGESRSKSYLLVQECFEDLLQGRFKAIEKKIGSQELSQAVQKLAKLSLRPTRAFQHEVSQPIAIDLKLLKIDEKWVVETIEEELPKVEIRKEYLELHPKTKEEKKSLKEWTLSAKWILRSLKRRRALLLEIGVLLVQKQSRFLENRGPLIELSMQKAAQILEIHESTLSRALHGKYLASPRGILPLKSLFPASPVTLGIKEKLQELILHEDKKAPLTDDEIADALKKEGFKVARRTVSKYRQELHIGSKTLRKHL